MERNVDYFKELYYKELERRDAYNNKVSTPLSVLIIIIGGGVFALQNISKIETGSFLLWIINILLVCSLFSIGWTIINLTKALTGYKYGYLPKPSALKEYYEESYDYYLAKGLGDQVANEKATEDLDLYVCNLYIELTDKNIYENDRKMGKIRVATNGLIISLCIIVIVLGCFIPSYYKSNDDVQNVRIIEVKQP